MATVQWQGQGQEQRQAKGKRQRQRQEQREQSVFRGGQEASCRARESYQLPSVRCAWTLAGDDTCPKKAKNDGTPQPPARENLASEPSGFDLASAGDDMSSMPATFRWRHLRRHRQVRDDRGNHRVSFPHRLHRHLSALEGVKNTVVEARTRRLNVSLVWNAGSSPPGVRGRRKTLPCALMLKLTRGVFPRLWCDTLAKRV